MTHSTPRCFCAKLPADGNTNRQVCLKAHKQFFGSVQESQNLDPDLRLEAIQNAAQDYFYTAQTGETDEMCGTSVPQHRKPDIYSGFEESTAKVNCHLKLI